MFLSLFAWVIETTKEFTNTLLDVIELIKVISYKINNQKSLAYLYNSCKYLENIILKKDTIYNYIREYQGPRNKLNRRYA